MLRSRLPCLQGQVGGGNRKELECVLEPSNAVNQYTVAVLKDNTIVGHLPKKSVHIYSLFLRRGGVIRYHVAVRRKCTDLLQGIKFSPYENIPLYRTDATNFQISQVSSSCHTFPNVAMNMVATNSAWTSKLFHTPLCKFTCKRSSVCDSYRCYYAIQLIGKVTRANKSHTGACMVSHAISLCAHDCLTPRSPVNHGCSVAYNM